MTSASQGLALARATGERGHEAIALGALGAAHAASGDPASATQCYADALALAETLEMRPCIARCCLGLGRLRRSLGDLGAGDELLARAVRLFSDMGAPAWVEEVRRAGVAVG